MSIEKGCQADWNDTELGLENLLLSDSATAQVRERHDELSREALAKALDRHTVQSQDAHQLNRSIAVPSKDAGEHYRYTYKGIKLDPFRICDIYGITDLGQGTIVKKGLRLGTAHKDRMQDLLDIRCCVDRMIEMMGEE